MSFSEQLKNARLNTGYTQQQVAEFMGITKSTYCGYETGKRQPDVAKIKQLASILNTSGDILLETGFANKTSTECNEKDGLISNEADSKLSPTKKRLIAETERMPDSKNPNLSDVHRQVILQLEGMNDEQIKAVLAFINTLDELEKSLTSNKENISHDTTP